MAVRIDKVMAPAPGFASPGVVAWLLTMAFVMGCMLCVHFLLLDDLRAPLPERFWNEAIAGSLLVWLILFVARIFLFMSDFATAERWRRIRQGELADAMAAGRRFQHVVAVSLHTALREVDEKNGDAQLAALGNGKSAVRAQPTWAGESLRHSHLARDEGDTPAQVVETVLGKILDELAPALQLFPANKPVDLLLQLSGEVPLEQVQALWEQAWRAAGIRQKPRRLEGSGLAVADRRLDSDGKIDALLLVVALRVGPAEVAESAEVAVGLLLANPTSPVARPLAYLHRPEQEHAPTQAGLRYAVSQALDWVPVEASAVGTVWSAGVDAGRETELANVLGELAMPLTAEHGMHRLDAVLGQSGDCAPWLAIAAAVESASATARAQLVVSGEGAGDQPLWCTVVAPASSQ